MKIVVVIPARGGSKGIPKKNLKDFHGNSLIAHSVITAKSCPMIHEVIVSSDNSKILIEGGNNGAILARRPHDISDDTASSEDAVINALTQLDYKPDYTILMQCTSPLTLADDINGLIAEVLKLKADSGFTVTDFHGFTWTGSGEPINHSKESRTMRQQLDKTYIENGALYMFKTSLFLKEKTRFCGKTILFEMPKSRSFEIDTPEDLEISRKLYELSL